MERMIRLMDKLSDLGGILSGIMICAGVLLVTAEIVMRSVFSQTLYITEEYSGYLMAALTFLALGYTLRHRAHIRMTFLQHAISEKRRLQLDMVCFVFGFVFCALLTWVTFLFFWDSVVSETKSMQISETPLAIPQFFLPAGSFMMMVQFIAEFFKSLRLLKEGDYKSVPEESEALGR